MKRLNTSRIILGMLLAVTMFCSLQARQAKAIPPPADTTADAPACDCEKPRTIDQPLNGAANIVARILEI